MKEIKNQWLEKYECKAPDYDFIDRDYDEKFDIPQAPLRYTYDNGEWYANANADKTGSAKIMFTGDITCFERQIEAAQTGDSYDFDYEFECIKPIFAQADLVVGNLETMIFPQAPYRTEKYVAEQNFHCNAPLEFLQAVKNAGFDVLTNANNHDMDTGAIGIGETIDYIEKFGFIHTGTFKEEKKRYQLINVNGIKVAIVAFATEHNNKRCNLTDEGVDFLLNDYKRTKAKKIVDQARADGADAVICCIHWGKENKLVHNESQEKIATKLAELGYDCIIGSHPHVLQDFGYVSAGEKKVPVFYSMGNFVSHNANCAKARTIIACIDVEKSASGVAIRCAYVPAFTSKSYHDKAFAVIPVTINSKDKANLKKFNRIADVLGRKITYSREVSVEDYIEDSCAKPQKKLDPSKLMLGGAFKTPFKHKDGKYAYSIYKDHAIVDGFDSTTTNSYTVPSKIDDIPITSLADFAFANSPDVKKINFNKNVTYISKGLCQGCTGLEGFQLSKGTTGIGEYAFEGCTKLSATVIKSGIEKIGEKAFANCTTLRSAKFQPYNVEIAPDAFENCPMVVFYCEKGSSAEKYANEHGIKVVNMVVE